MTKTTDIYQTITRETEGYIVTWTEYQNNRGKLVIRCKERGAYPKQVTLRGNDSGNFWHEMKSAKARKVA